MSIRSTTAAHKNPSAPPDGNNARDEMNDMYRWTRHVYDLSRKYYLLGRDILIRNIQPGTGETVCEVGCGTARNLRKMAVRYPQVKFYGIDASDEMLKTARHILKNHGLGDKVQVEQGFAESFEPIALFGQQPDKLVFSYALSIIPPWRDALDHALTIVKPGGEIHIVDFGGQDQLPKSFRKFLFWWLKQFHVFHKPEILNYLQRLEHEKKGSLKVEHLYKGYTYYAIFKKN